MHRALDTQYVPARERDWGRDPGSSSLWRVLCSLVLPEVSTEVKSWRRCGFQPGFECPFRQLGTVVGGTVYINCKKF